MKSQFYHHIFQIPDKVTIEKNNHLLKFSGPLGHTYINLQQIDPKGLGGIFLYQEKKQLEVISPSKSFFGLFKKLIENKFIGITRGFLIYLKIIGIGYRAHLHGQHLFLKLGYSHDIIYKIPPSIKLFLMDPTIICLFGLDKNQITQIAAKIRNLRRPSPYKGKGIRLVNEKILIKQGKKK
jgi:large subunit ribosomal protein L6